MYILVNGKTIKEKDKASFGGLMVIIIKVNGETIKEMVLVLKIGKMEIFMKVFGFKIKEKGKEYYFAKMVIK